MVMIEKAYSYLDRAFQVALVILFSSIVVVGGLQVFNRYVLNQSLSWSEEFQIYGHIWLIFLSIPVAYNRAAHIGMNLLVKQFSPKVQNALSLATHVLWLVLALFIVFYTTVVMGVAKNQTSPALGLRMDRAYMSLLVGGSYLSLLALRNVVESFTLLRTGELAGGSRC